MWAASPPRIALATTAVATLEAARGGAGLRLRAGDEGRQAIDIAGIGDDRLRLVLRLWLLMILRLRTMVAFAMLARLLLIALIGLLIVALLIVALLIITLVIALSVAVAHEGLLLLRWLRNEARLLAERREILTVVLAVIAAGADGLVAARLLVLAELFLGGRDQAEIVLGVLVVVFSGDRVARGARVARELKVFFGDV